MPRRENHRTPLVVSGVLYTDDPATTGIRLDTPAWLEWLDLGTTFYYDSPLGSFTAHCERRPRGGRYWIAYRRRAGALRRVHLGKAQHLTIARLDEVAVILNSPPRQENCL